jgi:hypothetical protein
VPDQCEKSDGRIYGRRDGKPIQSVEKAIRETALLLVMPAQWMAVGGGEYVLAICTWEGKGEHKSCPYVVESDSPPKEE